MLPTRRWAVLAGTACFFAVFAVLLGESTPLFAAGGLAAWLVVAQFGALRTMTKVDQSLSATVSVDRATAFVGDRTAVTMTASMPDALDSPVEVELVAPPSVDAPERSRRTVTIEPGATAGSTTCSVEFPIAGRIAFDTVRVTIEDRAGYFTETVTLDVDARCLVEPPAPDGVHIGQGGELVGATFGDHSSDQTGPGLVPHETRQYLPGDTLSQIDWRTTARMNQPYIREFESASDYLLSLVVDMGSHMNSGPTGRTMFSYAREVALGCIHAAELHGDPVSAQFVDDSATTWEFGPSSSSNAYQTIRRELLEVTPTDGDRRTVESSRPVAPADARKRSQSLVGDESAFATTLRPFLSDGTSYVSRVSDRPLFDAVKASCLRSDREDHLVLVTDDSAKVETYESVVVASKRSSQTTVFLTPNVLFGDVPTASGDGFDGFVDFEQFRKRLDRLPNVTAYEVAPRSAVELATAETAATVE
ncbi:DUF58 domain-containing protein [Haloferax mediterranei ATCC 33500]|uniref:DUF58 domain-containing protein n=1 Tax=Haloferax mediterranei (strain ATCC 33500 / DSM 1411 / JCM 8866 / NBRC 14739 / NCIMB 2177 / R-4) TaxID=523841 RepID=I3R6Q8_HALMT|nr:DUF58 domain-containing protein [Haloferax mediterranei]AFK19918.1 hypothetical protein HFX_2230 [Haloferax mediterranei ATCC 33500]ELZ99463.1 hypothetical protein C439_12954 [Haloferax mediterranei ATCC 33500]MDX5987332.1 DUF58 domain-containing protein [Haloferax mediterranei ATCC 33500]QCQ73847.1 DUF58 domain-containing protein [Haloferax mediterranei ATCC 33500]